MLKRAFGIYWIVVFVGVSTLALCAIAVVPGLRNRRAIARGGSRLVFALTGMSPSVSGLEHLPDETCVVVANHASYLDGIIMTAALPPRFAFVIKKEVTQVPLVHFFLRRVGSHFVERGDTRKSALDARSILRSARSDASLGFFPEGTFRGSPGLNRFRSGAFRIAAHADMPVVPTVIRGSRAILPEGAVLPVPGNLSVTLSAPVRSTEPLALLAAARRQIVDLLGEPDLDPTATAENADHALGTNRAAV